MFQSQKISINRGDLASYKKDFSTEAQSPTWRDLNNVIHQLTLTLLYVIQTNSMLCIHWYIASYSMHHIQLREQADVLLGDSHFVLIKMCHTQISTSVSFLAHGTCFDG